MIFGMSEVFSDYDIRTPMKFEVFHWQSTNTPTSLSNPLFLSIGHTLGAIFTYSFRLAAIYIFNIFQIMLCFKESVVL